ncbi:MAG TPA: HPr family phosphocarrier protein [Turneriella sp.]|nr:HPr family phosphocarrier protein [Turneriella sp.]HMY10141.1 HPr family phosphocarrier protein [Turneriella sp.]HNA78873.1 HPr family phosphocarrier protein [Turneriella sp.]HNE19340.1 HPr family phosphocarrier protein [Turneriella sp.]HNJ64458.1 HPr family phosphocarrier protein [Turneriella sp.]
MVSKTVTIQNETGVHARPAAVFVKMANRFPCEIFVEKDEQRINGKSIMGLMMLALTRDSRITVIAEGDKEADAVEALCRLVENSFVEA